MTHEASLVERLAAVPEAARARLLAGLSAADRDAFPYLWEAWARPAQLAPEGDWRTWLILAGRGFARAEGAAFIGGNGTNKPKGFLAGPITNEADGVRAFGTLQYLASGAAGGFAASNPQDRLIDLIQTLRTPYRQGAVFVMNAATLAVIRKFKTSDGAFLWQPALSEGRPDTLLGYPVIEAEDMGGCAGSTGRTAGFRP